MDHEFFKCHHSTVAAPSICSHSEIFLQILRALSTYSFQGLVSVTMQHTLQPLLFTATKTAQPVI